MRKEPCLIAAAATAALASIPFGSVLPPAFAALLWIASGSLCGVAITAQIQRRRPVAGPADELLPNTAHELRTPLTVVMAAVGMIREGMAQDDEEQHTLLTQASAACQLLAFLINDLVDDAAIRAGSMRLVLRDWSLGDLIDETAALLEPVALARGMRLEVDAPPADLVLHTDGQRLQQVLFNLVGNALKYAPDRSTVELRTSLVDGRIRFEVIDEGPGVPSDQQHHLFERFQRMPDRRTRPVPGSGIGLHVCRQIVERMGGRIGYRAQQDSAGAVFWFELEARRSALMT